MSQDTSLPVATPPFGSGLHVIDNTNLNLSQDIPSRARDKQRRNKTVGTGYRAFIKKYTNCNSKNTFISINNYSYYAWYHFNALINSAWMYLALE